MKRLLLTAALSLVTLSPVRHALPAIAVQAQRGAPSDGPACRPVSNLVPNPDLPEGSGIAASRRNPGLLWAHNDSAEPQLVKLDENGSTVGRVGITGAEVDDWEDIAVGPCGQQSCLYVADIGDNDGRRKHITVYRVAEPSRDDAATSAAEAFGASYPDGRHDAEALFVSETGDIYIVTKGDPGPVALYRFPQPPRTGIVMRLERVGQPLSTRNVPAADRPTAADISPDGEWVAVRTTRRVAFYRTADLTTGRWREAFRFDLSSLQEPRGEGIAFGRYGIVFLLGESGRASRQGSFAKLSCTLR